MRKKYFLGFIAVLAISAFVLYWDLKQTNFKALLSASKNINSVSYTHLTLPTILLV